MSLLDDIGANAERWQGSLLSGDDAPISTDDWPSLVNDGANSAMKFKAPTNQQNPGGGAITSYKGNFGQPFAAWQQQTFGQQGGNRNAAMARPSSQQTRQLSPQQRFLAYTGLIDAHANPSPQDSTPSARGQITQGQWDSQFEGKVNGVAAPDSAGTGGPNYTGKLSQQQMTGILDSFQNGPPAPQDPTLVGDSGHRVGNTVAGQYGTASVNRVNFGAGEEGGAIDGGAGGGQNIFKSPI